MRFNQIVADFFYADCRVHIPLRIQQIAAIAINGDSGLFRINCFGRGLNEPAKSFKKQNAVGDAVHHYGGQHFGSIQGNKRSSLCCVIYVATVFP